MIKINSIYNLDCLEFLAKVDNNTADVAIIDPPYNMHKISWDTFKSHKEFLAFSYKWIDALLPKLKETGSLYVFNTPFNSTFIMQYLLSKRMLFQNWITWDKRDGLGASKRRYSNGQETILFFTKSKRYTFNYDDIRLPYESTARIVHASKKGILKNGKRWFPNPKGKFCGEVWHITSERHKRKKNGKIQKMEHLTPKPCELVERIIKASSNKNDLILDCFVGSGTTAIVAKSLSRNFICNDKEKKYVSLANRQLKLIEAK
ncbi:modification methylase MboII [Spirochaetota bacterium]|nr:modification methylase MboII [Spirochaetota bacterium]